MMPLHKQLLRNSMNRLEFLFGFKILTGIQLSQSNQPHWLLGRKTMRKVKPEFCLSSLEDEVYCSFSKAKQSHIWALLYLRMHININIFIYLLTYTCESPRL